MSVFVHAEILGMRFEEISRQQVSQCVGLVFDGQPQSLRLFNQLPEAVRLVPLYGRFECQSRIFTAHGMKPQRVDACLSQFIQPDVVQLLGMDE